MLSCPYKHRHNNVLSVCLAGILKLANGVTNTAASLIPASVPRPVAKLGVIGVSSIIALWLFGKVRLNCSCQAHLAVEHIKLFNWHVIC